MPRADVCTTMAEVRAEIDRLDRDIVAKLAERLTFIEAAARIKPDRGQVRDEPRKAEVIARAIAEGARLGVPAPLIQAVYEQLVEQSIAHEMAAFETLQKARCG